MSGYINDELTENNAQHAAGEEADFGFRMHEKISLTQLKFVHVLK
jgi:hypothetical protein